MTLVDRIVAAHGGEERWRRARAVSFRLSAGGLAFASKGQRRALREVRATVATAGQCVLLETDEWAYRFDGRNPRPPRLRWTGEDVAAFAGAALWTYVALPFVLPRLDVEEQGDRVVVRFPPVLETHSPTQVLHVDGDGLIRRHDYTALAFGRWAHASQRVAGYETIDGLVIATRRRVYPSMWPHRPLLVWIDIDDVHVLEGDTGR